MPPTTVATPVEPVPVPLDVPDGYWEREASHSPQPWSPMNRSLLFPRRDAAIRATFARFGVLADALDLREIGGWEYARLVPPGGDDGPAPPAPIMWLLARVHPDLRRRVRAAKRAVREDLAGQTIARWRDHWRDSLAGRIRSLQDARLDPMSDDELRAHWDRVLALFDDGVDVHFDLMLPVALGRKGLVDVCGELLGWDEPKALELVAGLSVMSTTPAAEAAVLTRMAAERPAVRSLVDQADAAAAAQIPDVDSEFAEAFARYQHEFGMRGLRYEVAEPTLAEVPELTLATIRDQLRQSYAPAERATALASRREALTTEARSALADRPPADRDRFERALAGAQQAHPVHEENEFFTISAPIALLRLAVLEFGRRLEARGSVDARDDVFFLEIDEALDALGSGGDMRALVIRRRGERAWVLAHPGPASYGVDPGPPPPLGALPRESRQVMEAVLWDVDRGVAPESSAQRQDAEASVLHGLAASSGRCEGTVRVVQGEHEFDKLQAGDVLVCPITSPVWSVLFSRVSALVTDTGGTLSHPAIIAREFGIPAVVATGNGTEVLRDGQRVVVDGDAGTVERVG